MRTIEDIIFIITHPTRVIKAWMEIVGGGYAPLGVIITIIVIIILKRIGVLKLIKDIIVGIILVFIKIIRTIYLYYQIKKNSLNTSIYKLRNAKIEEEKVVFKPKEGDDVKEIKHSTIIKILLKPYFIFLTLKKDFRSFLNDVFGEYL